MGDFGEYFFGESSATARESRQRAALACAIACGRLTVMKHPGRGILNLLKPPRLPRIGAGAEAFINGVAENQGKNMSENRKKFARISVKVSGGEPVLIELFPAEAWVDGPAGQFRLRVSGRMIDRWYDLAEVGAAVTQIIAGEDPDLQDEMPPTVTRGQRISLPCEPYLNGELVGREGGHVESDDVVRGHDGRWYCIASGTTRRLGLVPIDEITIPARAQ